MPHKLSRFVDHLIDRQVRVCVHPLLFPLRACACNRALVSVAAGVARERKNTFMCVVVYESSSGHLTQTGESPGCWLSRREKGERERGGEKPRKDATAPRRVHRRSHDYGASLHRTIASRAEISSGEPVLVEKEVEGRGGGSYTVTAVWITVSHRHSSFHPE